MTTHDTADTGITHPADTGAIGTGTRRSKEYYFFYGSLMDPKVLRRVLQLDERPVLTPAMIVGYKIKMWGPYPALLHGEETETIRGMVYEVEGTTGRDRLQAYETNRYRIEQCIVDTGDNRTLRGLTFIWDGDVSELKEGTFDLMAGNNGTYWMIKDRRERFICTVSFSYMYEMQYVKSIYNMYHDVLCVCTVVYVRMCMYRSPVCTENGDATSQAVTTHKSINLPCYAKSYI